MGTRQVYEEKLKRGNLYHEPTMKPGLGSARCPRCLSLLNTHTGKSEWQISPVLRDATALKRLALVSFDIGGSFPRTQEKFQGGFGIGGLLSGIYGVNTGIPYVQSRIQGPKWLTFATKADVFIGLFQIPLLITCSAASAAFGGYALPRLVQLSVTSYYTAYSASHYGISLLTRRIEDAHTSKSR
ncbi:hypothetical protein ACFE04_029502 [Oxalis oulophora]